MSDDYAARLAAITAKAEGHRREAARADATAEQLRDKVEELTGVLREQFGDTDFEAGVAALAKEAEEALTKAEKALAEVEGKS